LQPGGALFSGQVDGGADGRWKMDVDKVVRQVGFNWVFCVSHVLRGWFRAFFFSGLPSVSKGTLWLPQSFVSLHRSLPEFMKALMQRK